MQKEVITTSEPYNDLDIAFITSELNDVRYSGFKRVLICLAAAIFIPVIPGRRQPAMADRMHYAKAFAIVLAITAMAMIYDYYKQMKLLKKELLFGQKVVIHAPIIAKHKSFTLKEKFKVIFEPLPSTFAPVDKKGKDYLNEIAVSEQEYEKLKIGDIIVFEFTPITKQRLRYKLPI